MRIGVISDTHGLLRPQALAELEGVAHILHAGDIGGAEIVPRLRGIAPVTAIRGNVDRGPWADAFPTEADLTLNGVAVHMLHDVKALAFDPAARGVGLVVSGHSHRSGAERRGETVLLNPGGAGPRRFRLPATLAVVELGPTGVKSWEIRDLAP